MVVRYETRLKEMMAQAEVPPESLDGLLDRLGEFVRPFAASLPDPWRGGAAEYVTGLLSDLGRKTAEGIAYLHDQDRQAMQKFIGQAPWDHRPSLDHPGAPGRRPNSGEPDGVIVFDPSAFAKKGTKSVGRGAAVVRPARQGRELPGRRLHGLRLP